MNNIVAGVIVGVVAIPLAMAFAVASGANPEQGLYKAIIAGLFVSIFGGTHLQIAGPTEAFVIVLSPYHLQSKRSSQDLKSRKNNKLLVTVIVIQG